MVNISRGCGNCNRIVIILQAVNTGRKPNFPSKSHGNGGILSFTGRGYYVKTDGVYSDVPVAVGDDRGNCSGDSAAWADPLCDVMLK